MRRDWLRQPQTNARIRFRLTFVLLCCCLLRYCSLGFAFQSSAVGNVFSLCDSGSTIGSWLPLVVSVVESNTLLTDIPEIVDTYDLGLFIKKVFCCFFVFLLLLLFV